MQNIYILSRKIHRFFVIITSVLIIIMAVTGIFLKYYNFADSIGVDLNLSRQIHNQASPYLTLALTVMLVTGLILYIYPWYIKRRRGKVVEKEANNIDAGV